MLMEARPIGTHSLAADLIEKVTFDEELIFWI
jgi:hypothetical protein